MSFKDEILGTVKSQQENQNEQFVKDIENAPQWAKSQYQILKDAITKEAEGNGIKIVDGKKVIESQCFLHNLSIIEQKLSDPGLDPCHPKRHLLKCKVLNEQAFKKYMDTLNKLSDDDEIDILYCGHYMENGKDYFIPIKDKNDVDNINIISRVTYRIDFVLKGKLVLD